MHTETGRFTRRRRVAARSPLPIALVVLASAAHLAFEAPSLAAQQPGQTVELTAGEVTSQRLIDLLQPPRPKKRGLEVDDSPQPPEFVRPQCGAVRRRLTRGLNVEVVRPVPAIPLQFAFNSAELTPLSIQMLDEIGKALTAPGLTGSCFGLVGYTDAIGSDAYNDSLSRRRAAAAAAYLTEKYGVEPERIAATGRGKQNPLGDNATEAGRQRNRRVEILNMGSGGDEPEP